MTRRPPHKVVTLMVALLVAVLAGYGLYWYAPWMRAFDTTVNDPLSVPPPGEPDPTRTNAVEMYMVGSGTFIAQQHKTSGTARLVRPGGYGNLRLELVDLDTSNGPDLRVWLSDQPVKADKSGWRVFGTGQRVEVGALKGNKGDQTYAIPDDRRQWTVRSVVIWSGRHDVAYGAAALD
jgi:hypothetical protein